MEVARFRRLIRISFFLAAMVVCFGLGLYTMGHVAAGVVLMILGAAVLMITFSITKTFAYYDFQHAIRKANVKPPEQGKQE